MKIAERAVETRVSRERMKSRQCTNDATGNAEGDDEDHGQSRGDDDARYQRAAAGIGRKFLFEELGEPVAEAFPMRKVNGLVGHVYIPGT